MLKRLCALALATAMILLVCVKIELPPEQHGAEAEQKLETVFDPDSYTQEMMLEDYDFFWTTLEENCASLGMIEKARGIDLEELKEEYRRKVTHLLDGSAKEFVQIMEELSVQFGSFAHIQCENIVSYWNATNSMGAESETKKEIFELEKVQSFYQWMGTIPLYEYQLKQTKKINENSEARDDMIDENVQLSREGDVAVVHLKSLLLYGEAQLKAIDKLQNFCQENLDAQHFIIDITGNNGGASIIWQKGLEPLWAGKTFTWEEVAAYKMGDWNVRMWGGGLEQESDIELRPISTLNTVEYPKLDMQSLEGCDGVATRTFTEDYTDVENPGGKEFEGRIWILTDSRVASSAELLVHFAKGNEPFTLVGTQTGGVGSFMVSPATVEVPMPNSGMLVKYTPFYFINEDGTCNDMEGTHPDIEIEPGETAMQRCLQEIKKLQK